MGSVGNYLDVQVQGSLVWPVSIKLYYTQNDLWQAGIVESDIQGVSTRIPARTIREEALPQRALT
jgi:hypothetical protein